MYTFQALATINTMNDHGGFYLITAICIALATLCLLSGDDLTEIRAYFGLFAAVIASAGAISYNTGSITTYANTPVEATLVGFQAEGYNIVERNGKFTKQVDKHEQFVVYAVPEGNVMFAATLGQTYPPKAILYKN